MCPASERKRQFKKNVHPLPSANFTNAYRPIVVDLRQSVSHGLMDFRRKIGRIVDDVEIGGRNCSLIDFLRHQEEIEAVA